MFLTPERSMEIQAALGSDIAMLFDECPHYPCERSYAEKSTALTTRWARRCRDWHREHAAACFPPPAPTSQSPASTGPSAADSAPNGLVPVERTARSHPATQPQAAPEDAPRRLPPRQLLFGIVQGSVFPDLRAASARDLAALDLDGYAIGGVSVGEPEAEMFRAVDHAQPFLPAGKPRYAMGLGTPPQMLEMIARGIDLFDCVHPTRSARHGLAFTPDGPIHIKNAAFERDPRPLDPDGHPRLQRFSRAYLRHLFRAGEMLALRLLSFHNLDFYLRLMRRARVAIEAGDFASFQHAFCARYQQNRTR